MENQNFDVENPEINSSEKIELEHENIDEIYEETMNHQLDQIKKEFIKNMPNTHTYNSYLYLDSNSPLTISCNNSDCDVNEKQFKEFTYDEMKENMDKYLDYTYNKYSN